MGIYDRDYYRNEQSGFNPFSGRVRTCYALMALYFAIFVIQISSRESARRAATEDREIDFHKTAAMPVNSGRFTEFMELKSNQVLNGEVWRVVTYAFVHDPLSVPPILLTIICLFWLGRQVEDIYGWKEFLAYYLFVGLLGGVAFVGVAAMTNAGDPVLIGPSASVTAVMFLFALHYPRQQVFGYVPIWFVLIAYVAIDTRGVLSGHLHPSVFAVHGVGAGFALLYHQYSLRVSNWLPGFPSQSASRSRAKPKLQIFRDPNPETPGTRTPAGPSGESTPNTATAAANGTSLQTEMDEHLEAKLDVVLEKVKKHGQDSLNEEERAILFRASEIYRKRRKKIGE